MEDVSLISDEETEARPILWHTVTILEDSVIELVEKIFLDALMITSSDDHTEISNQTNRLIKQITLEVESLPQQFLEFVTPVLEILTFLRNEKLVECDTRLDLLERYSNDTTLKTHDDLDVETRLRKLVCFVESICLSDRNAPCSSRHIEKH